MTQYNHSSVTGNIAYELESDHTSNFYCNRTPPYMRNISHNHSSSCSPSCNFHLDVSVHQKNLETFFLKFLSTSLSCALPLLRKQVLRKLGHREHAYVSHVHFVLHEAMALTWRFEYPKLGQTTRLPSFLY